MDKKHGNYQSLLHHVRLRVQGRGWMEQTMETIVIYDFMQGLGFRIWV